MEYSFHLLLVFILFSSGNSSNSCDDPDVTVLIADWSPGRLLQIKHDISDVNVLPLNDVFKPVAIGFDHVTRKIFWTDDDLKKIKTSDLDGKDEKDFLTLANDAHPIGMAIDSTNRKLFFTDYVNKEIGIMDLDTPRLAKYFTMSHSPLDITTHPEKRLFFWSAHKPFPFIARTKYNGKENEKIVRSGLMMPTGLTLDTKNDILYWCDQLTKKVEKVTVRGTDRQIFLHEEKEYFDVFFYNRILYFTDVKTKSIQHVPTDGSSYVASIGSTLIGQMSRIHVSQASADNRAVTILGSSLYPGQILKVTQRQPDIIVLPISDITRPVAVDYDFLTRSIVWTDVFLKFIRKTTLDGADDKLLLDLNTKSVPDGITVDNFLRKVFFTDTGNDVIASMDLDGSNLDILIDSGLTEPRAIVLNERERVMFWSDWGEFPYIARASYNGTARKTLVNTGLIWPNGLTIDNEVGVLYWCDAKTHRIESVHTDGTGRRRLLYEPTAHYFDIFYLDGMLYFTDWHRKAINRMSPSGTEVTSIGSTFISQPVGLHVISNKNHTGCVSSVIHDDLRVKSAQKYLQKQIKGK